MAILMVFSLLPYSGVRAENQEKVDDADTKTYRFDFGSEDSPVENGYLQVPNTLIYDEALGYGFNEEVGYRDRGEPDDLRRDFVLADGAEFMVDVPDGDYFVRIIAGDDIAFNRTNFVIEGEDKGSITSDSGEYSTLETNVAVTDGQLNIEIGENGRMNGLEKCLYLKLRNST